MKKASLLFLVLFIISCNTKQGVEHVSNDKQRPTTSDLVKKFDENRDGKLSKTEVKGGLANDFSTIDKDNDGYLTADELGHAPKPKKREESKISQELIDGHVKTVPLNLNYFVKENIIEKIKQEKFNLSGIETLCYVIKTNSRASEHQMGPWCPKHIKEGAEKAGIWFKDGKVYDVSGNFISKLDEFYNDDKWKLYRDDGTIRVTNTKEGCLAAAKPNVDEEYHNFCVECLPDYFKDQETTFIIPVKPQYLSVSQPFGRGGIGVAFNGVKFDPPAPTHAILAAHTIAPLDDHGGHVNPHGGYHYHAVTGSTKEIEQDDTHAPLLGYAMDGFGIYALLDKNGNEPIDLDECGGHIDEKRGYHYHAGKPGGNQIIKCLHGLPGYSELKE